MRGGAVGVGEHYSLNARRVIQCVALLYGKCDQREEVENLIRLIGEL